MLAGGVASDVPNGNQIFGNNLVVAVTTTTGSGIHLNTGGINTSVA